MLHCMDFSKAHLYATAMAGIDIWFHDDKNVSFICVIQQAYPYHFLYVCKTDS